MSDPLKADVRRTLLIAIWRLEEAYLQLCGEYGNPEGVLSEGITEATNVLQLLQLQPRAAH